MPQLQYNHEYSKLTIENGNVVERSVPFGSAQPYMKVHPVQVIDRLSFVPTDDQKNYSYRFKLRSITDPIWRTFFTNRLRDLEVKFNGDEMSFSTHPANLESNYAKVKASIEQTNQDYLQEAEALKAKVFILAQERENKVQEAKRREEILKKQFNDLKL